MPDVLAVLEQRAGVLKQVSHEALTAARGVADSVEGSVHAMVVGPSSLDLAGLGRFGADHVIVNESESLYQPDLSAEFVVHQVRTGSYAAVIVVATAMGRDLAPRVAARLDCPLAADVTSITGANPVTVTRPVYSGKAIYSIEIPEAPCVISIRANVFTPSESPREATVERRPTTEASIRARTLEVKQPEKARLDVAEAPVVVSGGRGLKDPANFTLVEDLADAFGNAAVGASRAVVDAGWRPHSDQVGQTGKTVSPQLYVAVGISGAIQHLAGMRTSKVIVAINKDKDSPIFKVADYGLVGDLFEIVPRLTEEIRKVRDV